MPGLVRYSPLYARFNGFSLGAFLGGAQQPLATPRYRAIRTRVHEFLEETDIGLRMPARHAAFMAVSASLVPAIKAQLLARDTMLHACCGLGEMAVLFAGSYHGISAAQHLRVQAQMVPALQRLGLGPLAYKQFADGLAQAAQEPDGNALVTQVYLLLSNLLQPLGPEPDSCFVAMPFARPYAGYFSRLYRPGLEQAGFRAIRAWGGLAQEEYYPFIAPLIARCAAVLADLSARNLNVANEVGLAHGANCPSFLLMRQGAGEPPSNLASLALLHYDPQAPDWPAGQVQQLADFVGQAWDAYVQSLTQEDLIHATAQHLVQMLRADGRAVPDALLDLAHIQR